MLRKPALGFKEESHKQTRQRFTSIADAHMLASKDAFFFALRVGWAQFFPLEETTSFSLIMNFQ